MAIRHLVYASGEQSNRTSVWKDHIFASHLKDGSWSLLFETDIGEYGRHSKSIRKIRSPNDFVDSLYSIEDYDVSANFINQIISNLFPVAPTFSVACSIYSDIYSDGSETDHEDFLSVSVTFILSNPSLSTDFKLAKSVGKKLFKALIDCQKSENRTDTLSVDNHVFPIIWSKRVSKDLQRLQTAQLVEEHCRKSEWKRSTGHSQAAIGNGFRYSRIKKFASEYYAEHGKLPVGDFVLDADFMRSDNIKVGELAISFK
jgi:hypothetical protein